MCATVLLSTTQINTPPETLTVRSAIPNNAGSRTGAVDLLDTPGQRLPPTGFVVGSAHAGRPPRRSVVASAELPVCAGEFVAELLVIRGEFPDAFLGEFEPAS